MMKTNSKVVSVTQGIMIVTIFLNFIFLTSRVSGLPWYIEDAWGYLGLAFTFASSLVVYFVLLLSKKKNPELNANEKIPLAAAGMVIFLLIRISDPTFYLALIANTTLLIATIRFYKIK